MRMTLRLFMAKQEPNFEVLAGAGGVALGVQPAEMYFQNMWKKFLGHQYKDNAVAEVVGSS